MVKSWWQGCELIGKDGRFSKYPMGLVHTCTLGSAPRLSNVLDLTTRRQQQHFEDVAKVEALQWNMTECKSAEWMLTE